MKRGRTLLWMIVGSVVAVAAVVIALIEVNSGTPSKAASSTAPPVSASASPQASKSASASPQAGKSAPVVMPKNSSTSSYLADLKPSGNFSDQVIPGSVKISGSIYPKSISFYCNNGDPAATPTYKLRQNARRFNATIGLEAKWGPPLKAGISILGDGHTLQTFNVTARKPKTVSVDIAGVHTLQLECFSAGISPSGSWAVAASWGNARFSGKH